MAEIRPNRVKRKLAEGGRGNRPGRREHAGT